MPEVKQRRRPQRGREISWETAFDRARRVASVLRERGVLPGERFHVHLTSSAGECRFGVVCEHVRDRAAHDRNGRAPGVSTDDRLTLASVNECGSADVVVRHDRWSSRACVSGLTTDAFALAAKGGLDRTARGGSFAFTRTIENDSALRRASVVERANRPSARSSTRSGASSDQDSGGSPPVCANVLLTNFQAPAMRFGVKKSMNDKVPQ
jgi:hypothetical protein